MKKIRSLLKKQLTKRITRVPKIINGKNLPKNTPFRIINHS